MDKKNTFIGGFSPQLMKENIKQSWFMPALLLILYFLCGIFPLIFLSKGYGGAYALESLNNSNFIYGSFAEYYSLIVACMVMSVYHNKQKAFALHAQPYTKAKLFNTQIITGWVMIVVPILITALIYVVIMGFVKVEDVVQGLNNAADGTGKMVQAYHLTDVLIWILDSIAIYTFFYGLSVLAGSLVGNTLMQVLGSLVFYSIIPALVIIIIIYEIAYIPGFSEPGKLAWNVILNSNPLSARLADVFITTFFDNEKSGFVAIAPVWHFLIGLVMIVLAKFACFKAKLEKVGQSMIFNPVEAVVTVVLSFIGAACSGLIFGLIFDTMPTLVFGMLAGGALTFFIVKLIMTKNTKFFNKTLLKTFIALLVIILIFLLIFVFNIFGLDSRLPNASDIESVNAADILSGNTSHFNGNIELSGDYLNTTLFSKGIESPSVIEKCLKLNKYILKEKLDDKRPGDGDKYLDMEFSYKLKDGSNFTKSYTVIADDKTIGMLNDILNDSEVKKSLKIDSLYRDHAVAADISFGSDKMGYKSLNIVDKADIKSLIDQYNKDVENSTYDAREALITYSYDYYEDEFSEEVDDELYIGITITLNGVEKYKSLDFTCWEDDENVIEWLKTMEKKYHHSIA